MAIVFTNGASTLLAAGIDNVQTSLVVTTGEGTLFPSLGVGDYFVLVVEDAAANSEIMQCTARTTDTFTVVRGFDGSTAQAFSAGARVELRLTAHTEEEMIQRSGDSMTGQLKGITPVDDEDLSRKDYVDTKAALVTGTNNNIATLDGTGELKDSLLSVANLSQAELDILDGATVATADLNAITGIDATGVTVAEIGYLAGADSNIQNQLDIRGQPSVSPTEFIWPYNDAGTWLGPTGSVGTDSITDVWSVLDNSTATYIEIKADVSITASATANTNYYLQIYGQDNTGSGPDDGAYFFRWRGRSDSSGNVTGAGVSKDWCRTLSTSGGVGGRRVFIDVTTNLPAGTYTIEFYHTGDAIT
jgi:hypothetical protein